jgi:TolB-like protein
MSLFTELKRRNVIRVAAAYLVLSWLSLQVADVLEDAFELPVMWTKAVVAMLVLGFIPVMIISWVYEMTPSGLKRESEVGPDTSVTAHTARKLDMAVILMLVVAIVIFAMDRYVGTSAVTQPLPQQSAQPATKDTVPVVAVLPLQALSTDDEGIFLASGLHDDLLTRLARLESYRVISRTSVMEYANTTKNIRQIGAELGAAYILEGGLQAIGGNVRINAQLIIASTDEHLWAETFDRELTTANLFDVQAEIANAIAIALHAALSPQEVERISGVPTENLEAYQAYLHGRNSFGILTKPAIEAAIDGARRAVELDPEFAEAWASLSASLIRKFWEEGAEADAAPDTALRDEARLALDRAQEIDPDNIEAIFAEMLLLYYGHRDYSGALSVLDRAETVAPNDYAAIAYKGYLFRRLGQFSDAADALMLGEEVNPNNVSLLREIMNTLISANRCVEASARATSATVRYPFDEGILGAAAYVRLICDRDIPAARDFALRINITTLYQLNTVQQALTYAGDYRAAIDVLVSARDTWVKDPITRAVIANWLTWLYRETDQLALSEASMQTVADIFVDVTDYGAAGVIQLAMTAALRGDVTATRELALQAMESLPEDGYLRPSFLYAFVQIYAVAGMDDEALDVLEAMLAEPGGRQEEYFEKDPYLSSLQGKPRFERAAATR